MPIRSLAIIATIGVLAQAPACAQSTAAKPAASPAKPSDTIEVTAASQAPKSAISTYRISAGDQIEIYVWGDERLQRMVTVLPDGTFGFPLAGTVMAAGRTTNDVETEISKLLAPQYKGVSPQVTASIKTSTGMQISVIGKVKGPGTFTPTRYVTVLDALALSGGPTDFADVGNIVILRTVGGKSQVIKAKLGNVLKGRAPEGADANPQLLAGDTVIVP